jgi:hypothetical protein
MNLELWKSRIKHLSILGLLAGAILIPESSSVAVLYSIGVVLSLVFVTQLVRYLAFRYIDLEELVNSAKTSSVGSAVVVMSITLYMIAVLFSATMILS